MKRKILYCLLATALIIHSCQNRTNRYPNYELGEFGAFYTRIQSDEEFEKFSRVRDHPDIIVDLGKGDMTFNFWRGSSYLPYLESPNGRWYVTELVNRKGDGTRLMPDRTNVYSHVKIISTNKEKVIVHWRYLPVFEGGNPQKGVAPDKFVDEYYFINNNGNVKRTVKKGTKNTDDWNNSANLLVETFTLTKKGIKSAVLEKKVNDRIISRMEGNPVVEPLFLTSAWWNFDEGIRSTTRESVGKMQSEVAGSKVLWRKGVSGTALQFDGYQSEISFPAEKAPEITGAVTLEGWVALGAYPWSDVPIVQQLDDLHEELGEIKGKKGTKEYQFVLKEETDKGYFLGIDGYGKPVFKIHTGGKLHVIKADSIIERYKWYHLAATFDNASGWMKIYLNGKKAGQKKAGKTNIEMSDKNIRIGKGKDRRPVRPVRLNTFSDSYSLDGLIDEIKIYDHSLSEEQVAASFGNIASGNNNLDRVDMDHRSLPKGENRNEFGAYYTHLKFYDVWDNLWRFGNHPDVVVEFDNSPCKFIFWRGAGYIPMMVNDKEQWYSNEFNETWGKSGGKGCQEPMSDKEAFTNHARILENTPARTVVHWRYPLIDVNHVMANYTDSTGWCDLSDWYYYIYPDGVAVKSMKLWTDGQRNHEWQESMAIMGPDQHPEEIIHAKNALSMMDLKGKIVSYDWITGPPYNVDLPKQKCIQIINYTGKYKPVTIGKFVDSNVYNGEVTEYSVFPTWNHWPVSQMPSDGRYATYPDRTAHSSLTHLFLPNYNEDISGPTPFYEKLLMEAMLDKDSDELISLAKSWLKAPEISGLKGGTGEYRPDQRAYVIERESDNISFSLEASPDSPVNNVAFIVKNWNSREKASVKVNNEVVSVRQGIFRDTNGTKTMAVWIEINENENTFFEITSI